MAKYSLILKDSTFVKLLKDAGDKGLTFGRYVNDCLNKLAEDPKEKGACGCFVCGEKPKIEVHGFNAEPIFLCAQHQLYKKMGQGWRELEG